MAATEAFLEAQRACSLYKQAQKRANLHARVWVHDEYVYINGVPYSPEQVDEMRLRLIARNRGDAREFFKFGHHEPGQRHERA